MIIALLDEDHVHHGAAYDWLRGSPRPWASCPLTQNGFLRIVTQPAYPGRIAMPDAVRRLTKATSTDLHEFWTDDISLLDSRLFVSSGLMSSSQLTDVYLLGLAVRHQGVFVTFDRAVPLATVSGATAQSLMVL